MFLVVGLGNPGAEYAASRHNVGFMAADELHRRYNFSPFKAKFDGLIAEGTIEGEKIYLLKPQTYMNLSGNSVVKTAHFYKILPQNIVVIHDDMDLPVGKIKAKIGGGSGGHNGIKSIDAAISPNYNRIRIGVGHPADKSGDNVANYVLSGFNKADKQNVEHNIDIAADLLPVLLTKGIAEFSNQLGMKLASK
ncbi:MAG: aminoacyl-tRNA hydrolase [Alphaproteobacteria bacterium]|nr:aminoacyl-tRNA hydrolase [Alphaproteobacteria bacterium]